MRPQPDRILFVSSAVFEDVRGRVEEGLGRARLAWLSGSGVTVPKSRVV